MLEKMIFQSQEEEADFEKYRQLKGDDLYVQIFRILSEKTPKVKYVTVGAYIRYDKNLRDKLYIYLATLEEYCKARLLHSFDVCAPKKYQGHCHDTIPRIMKAKAICQCEDEIQVETPTEQSVI